jgi:hypothetical protein
MTTEERVEYLEDKLARTIEVLKLFVRLDGGLTKDNTAWLIELLEEVEK